MGSGSQVPGYVSRRARADFILSMQIRTVVVESYARVSTIAAPSADCNRSHAS
jgi:hypothetical protein